MNVVIFGKGFGKPRQVNLSGFSAWAAAVGIAAIVSAAGFVGGYWLSSTTGSGVSQSEVANLSTELDAERVNIATIRQENEDTLDALAIRIAQMNARVIRLDALGRRLTDMADIDDGEFDFDSLTRRWRSGRAGSDRFKCRGTGARRRRCRRSITSSTIARRSSGFWKAC